MVSSFHKDLGVARLGGEQSDIHTRSIYYSTSQFTLQCANSSVSRLLSNLRSCKLEARFRLEEEAEWDKFASICTQRISPAQVRGRYVCELEHACNMHVTVTETLVQSQRHHYIRMLFIVHIKVLAACNCL